MDPRPGFRGDLEGLRGVAILLVVLFHAGVSTFAGGFVGVDVFFVLSGFFITQVLLRELREDGTIELSAFYGRRALRLVPSLMVVLLTTLALVMWLYAPIDRAEIAGNARAVAFGSGNVAFATGAVNYFNNGDNPLLHTWSLAVEEQFYFVWPLLLLLITYVAARRARASEEAPSARALITGFAIAGAVSFAASLYVTETAQPWAFFGMPTRIWEFALGGIVAVWLGSRTSGTRAVAVLLQIAGVLMVMAAVASYDSTTPYPGMAAVLPALATVAFLVGGHPLPAKTERQDVTPTPVSHILAFAPLQWLGRVSYGWYLWHWPLIGLAGVLHPGITPLGKMGWALLALIPAWLAYRFVEGSAREGRLSRIRTEWLAPLALIVTVAAALIAHGTMLAAERQAATPQQRTFAAARSDRMKHDCWVDTVDEPKGPCEFGDTSSTTTVVLIGDSHAEHWLGALDRIGRERRWKVVTFVKGGCPVAEMPELRNSSRARQYRECVRFHAWRMRRVLEMHPNLVVLSSWDHYVRADGEESSWQVTPDLWHRGLRRTYERLSAARIPTVALRGTPRTWFDVPACLSRRAADVPLAGHCEYDASRALVPPARAAQTRAARGLQVPLIDMNDQICASAPCDVVRNGVVVFTDDNHLTSTFSRSAAPVLSTRIDAALTSVGQRAP